MATRRNLSRLFVVAAALALLVSGAALLAASFLAFDSLKPRIDALAADASADPFTAELFVRIAFRSRVIGLAMMVAAAVLHLARNRAHAYLGAIPSEFIAFKNQATPYLKTAIKDTPTLHRVVLAVILLIAVGLRLSFLSQPMRFDEASTFLRFAARPFAVGLAWYESPNNHVFHTLLVHISYMLFGPWPWALRLPALFAGIVMVPAAYCTARMLSDKNTALLAAGLVTSSSILIEYSTNARGYTLIGLFFLLLISLGVHLRHHRSPAAWLLFTALAALGFFTIPIMLYAFGILLGWLAISTRIRSTDPPTITIRNLCTCAAATILLTASLYLPALIVSGPKAFIANEIVLPKSWSYLLAQFPASCVALWRQWNRDIPVAVAILLAIGFLTAILFHRRIGSPHLSLALAVPGWCIPVLAVQRVVPFERVWLFLLPLCLIIASTGIRLLLRPIETRIGKPAALLFPLLALALCIPMGINVLRSGSVLRSTETGTLRDAETITLRLKDDLQAGDRLFSISPSGAPLEYYFFLHGLGPEHLAGPLESARRIFVVVNRAQGQTLQDVLGAPEMQSLALPAPKLLHRYETARLYELRKPAGPDP